MRMLNKTDSIKFITACFCIMLFSTSALSITSDVSPGHISVNSFYHGSKIVVTGEIGADEDIIIKISSPYRKTHLRKKGKAGGILWMNIGELEIDPVPDVYLLYATQDIDTILSEKEQDKYAVGYAAFERFISVSPVTSEEEKEKWFNEFIKFKEKNRIYGVFSENIETVINSNKKTYKLTIDWPYQAPPQEYTVSAYSVKDNTVHEHSETSLVVEKVGILNFLSNMAFNNSVVYGAVSILIAIAAGFIVSMIFEGGKGRH